MKSITSLNKHKPETVSKLIRLNKSLQNQIYKDDKIDTIMQIWESVIHPDDITLIGIYCQDSLIQNIYINEAQDIILQVFKSIEGPQFIEIFIKRTENIETILELMFKGNLKCEEIIKLILKINSKAISNIFSEKPKLLKDLRRNTSIIFELEDESFKKTLVLDSVFEFLSKSFKENIKCINHILKDSMFSQNYFFELNWLKRIKELTEKELITFLDSLFDLKNPCLHKFQSIIKEDWIYSALKFKNYSLLLKLVLNNTGALRVIFENLYLIEYSNDIDFIEFMGYLMKFQRQIEREIVNNKYILFVENVFLLKIISVSQQPDHLNIITLELITLFVYLQLTEQTTYDFITYFKETVLFMLYSIKKYNSSFIIKYLMLILLFDFEFSDEERMFLRELKEFNENIAIQKITLIYLNGNLEGYLYLLKKDYTLRDINIFIKKYLLDKIEYLIELKNKEIKEISNALEYSRNVIRKNSGDGMDKTAVSYLNDQKTSEKAKERSEYFDI